MAPDIKEMGLLMGSILPLCIDLSNENLGLFGKYRLSKLEIKLETVTRAALASRRGSKYDLVRELMTRPPYNLSQFAVDLLVICVYNVADGLSALPGDIATLTRASRKILRQTVSTYQMKNLVSTAQS